MHFTCIKNNNPFPKIIGRLKVLDMVMELSMKSILNLVTSRGIELAIIILMGGQVIWVHGVESLDHHFPKLLVTSAKMRLHSRLPIGKVSSIKFGNISSIVNMWHL
jgi:hypothetical protein